MKQQQRLERLEAEVAANLARDVPLFLILADGEDREAELAGQTNMRREQRRSRRKTRNHRADARGSRASRSRAEDDTPAEEHAIGALRAARAAPRIEDGSSPAVRAPAEAADPVREAARTSKPPPPAPPRPWRRPPPIWEWETVHREPEPRPRWR